MMPRSKSIRSSNSTIVVSCPKTDQKNRRLVTYVISVPTKRCTLMLGSELIDKKLITTHAATINVIVLVFAEACFVIFGLFLDVKMRGRMKDDDWFLRRMTIKTKESTRKARKWRIKERIKSLIPYSASSWVPPTMNTTSKTEFQSMNSPVNDS